MGWKFDCLIVGEGFAGSVLAERLPWELGKTFLIVEKRPRTGGNVIFLAIDDGSREDTLTLLKRLQEKLGSRLEIISRENRGHVQTCLQGYRIPCERKIPFVFQIDSDRQCDPLK